ncbi:MAG: shikimate kinase [Clostridia bacterium]|nr:shikimate kinase [Clostridia bacterium]
MTKMKNIVLIGMPGSGKTSVGVLVAQALGRALLDTDAMVEGAEGVPIPTLFGQWGEEYFRDVESSMARKAAAAQGAVISTGGGMVLRPENMEALGATGIVCFLDRSPEEIVQDDHTGRPLIGGDREKVFALYARRITLYQQYAQVTIPSRGTAEETAQALLKTLEGKL